MSPKTYDVTETMAALERAGAIRDARHRALLASSLAQLGDGTDPEGDAELIAFLEEKLDPKAIRAAKLRRERLERQEAEDAKWEGQGLDLDDVSYAGPAALARAARGKYVWLYHGTSSRQVPRILRDGLTIGEAKVDPDETPGVYLTAQRSGAVDYADRAARVLGGRGVVLRVLVPFDELEPDSDDADIRSGDWQFVTDYVPTEAILEVDGKRRKKATTKRRGNPVELGDVARVRVLGAPGRGEADASIGHPFLFPGETVVEHWSEERQVGGESEPVYVTVTSMPVPGGGTSGRILLSYDEKATVAYGGIYFLNENGRTCVQSIYLASDYRGSGFGAWLAEIAKSRGVTCVFGPVSDDGRAWADRYKLPVVDEYRENPAPTTLAARVVTALQEGRPASWVAAGASAPVSEPELRREVAWNTTNVFDPQARTYRDLCTPEQRDRMIDDVLTLLGQPLRVPTLPEPAPLSAADLRQIRTEEAAMARAMRTEAARDDAEYRRKEKLPNMREITAALHGADVSPIVAKFHASRGPVRARWMNALATLSTGELLELIQLTADRDTPEATDMRQSMKEALASRRRGNPTRRQNPVVRVHVDEGRNPYDLADALASEFDADVRIADDEPGYVWTSGGYLDVDVSASQKASVEDFVEHWHEDDVRHQNPTPGPMKKPNRVWVDENDDPYLLSFAIANRFKVRTRVADEPGHDFWDHGGYVEIDTKAPSADVDAFVSEWIATRRAEKEAEERRENPAAPAHRGVHTHRDKSLNAPAARLGTIRIGEGGVVFQLRDVPINLLHPTQHDVERKTVESFVDAGTGKIRPIEISADFRSHTLDIDDGHHRVAALRTLGSKSVHAWTAIRGAGARLSTKADLEQRFGSVEKAFKKVDTSNWTISPEKTRLQNPRLMPRQAPAPAGCQTCMVSEVFPDDMTRRDNPARPSPDLYSFGDLVGCAAIVKTKRTGQYGGVYIGDDADAGAWSAICEGHGTVVGLDTLAAARTSAADTTNFCDDCRDELPADADSVANAKAAVERERAKRQTPAGKARLAPESVQLLEKFREAPQWSAAATIPHPLFRTLIRKGLLTEKQHAGRWLYTLTPKGAEALTQLGGARRENPSAARGQKTKRVESPASDDEDAPRAHRPLPLAEVERWRPLAARGGVSDVARGPSGFLRQYEAAKGRLDRLTPERRAKRDAFLERHLAQARARGEAMFAKGMPTRRHLALIMWAYSPEPAQLAKTPAA
jgi:hypothetical protein